jgi:tRNA-specific adenosine deaminase 1
MKCLPKDKVPKARGIVIHDWHAEILAIRSLNRFLLEECLDLALSRQNSSEYIRFRSDEERTETHFQPFALKDDINLHMYCSEAPCKLLNKLSLYYAYISQVEMQAWSSPWQLKKTLHLGQIPHHRTQRTMLPFSMEEDTSQY